MLSRWVSFTDMVKDNSINHPGPLSGLKIVDISSVIAAPFSSSLLAKHGADVIKLK
jgi:formyl-CoA transferase